MASFGKRVDGPGGRRRIERRRVRIYGSASSLEDSTSVIIENLCFSGAQVFGHDLPMMGTKILLRSSDKASAGRIAWSHGERRGIVFDGVSRPAVR